MKRRLFPLISAWGAILCLTCMVHAHAPSIVPLPGVDAEVEDLPPLEEELWLHGGSYMYQAEGDRLNWPDEHDGAHYDLLRLPESWREPRPLTMFADFLGADPIEQYPLLKWPGRDGYSWEPRVVVHGAYQMFGLAFEQNDVRRDAVGHQLLADFDLRLTGTERFHVQYRPIGEKNTGGSFYQFNDPEGYVDNSTLEPDRYWFEFELHSVLGSFLEPFAVRDYHVVAGRFPFALHNSLLMDDDVIGAAVNKNTIYLGALSNLNVQLFYAANEVDAFPAADAQLYGVHVTADHRRVFWEASYAFLEHEFNDGRDAHFAAVSRSKHYGPLTIAARALFKWGDDAGRGSGELFVIESNYTRVFHANCAGLEHGVFYVNAFGATEGWNPISGGNFNRLRTAFEVNPLVAIAAGRPPDDTWGAAAGVQLFRHHADESLIPEIAYESPGGEPVYGFGLRYLRKTGPRTFFELLGVKNYSDDDRFDREGVFISETIVF